MNPKKTQQTHHAGGNVAHHLRHMAQLQPYKRAVVHPSGRTQNGRMAYSHLTFRQLDRESDRVAHGLANSGITQGMHTVLMVKPSLEFFVLTFALFKIGAVPVVVDPGMGIGRMVECFRQACPEAFIGIPLAHALRKAKPSFFKSVHTWITVGKRWFWGGMTYTQLLDRPWHSFEPVATEENETAAILFTTGSTGPPKGVIYTHTVFNTQIQYIKSHFAITLDEIDLPTFPLFALFDPALGMTAVIPEMDPTKPAKANPEKIIEAILNHGVTNMFASPALLDGVGRFGQENNVYLPSLKRVVSAGAPVSPQNIARFSQMLNSEALVHTPYGATEAMPVTSIGSREIMHETRPLSEKGYGICVGHPVGHQRVELIHIMDESIEKWTPKLKVPDGKIGEITVFSPLATPGYFENPVADAIAKIADEKGQWHRMGDLGWRDNIGRIWMCGRKSHRVITQHGTLYTIPCEAIFNNHEMVYRSALVGVGPDSEQQPVICIELNEQGRLADWDVIEEELMELAQANPITRLIRIFLRHKSFPVDIRHNAKIFREKLAVWAERKIKWLPPEKTETPESEPE